MLFNIFRFHPRIHWRLNDSCDFLDWEQTERVNLAQASGLCASAIANRESLKCYGLFILIYIVIIWLDSTVLWCAAYLLIHRATLSQSKESDWKTRGGASTENRDNAAAQAWLVTLTGCDSQILLEPVLGEIVHWSNKVMMMMMPIFFSITFKDEKKHMKQPLPEITE